ncbi:MAG: DMT family transporter [Eubacterium sp.]
MIGILIAIISGALMSVQGVFNTDVTKNTSIWVANSWVQFTAIAVCLTAWGISDRSSFAALFKMQPKYVLLGGADRSFLDHVDGSPQYG